MVLNYTSYDHNESTQVQLPEAAGILMVVWVYMDLVLPEEPGLSHLKDIKKNLKIFFKKKP